MYKYIVKYQIKIHFSYSLGYRFSIELPVLEGQEGHSQVSIINLAGRNQILRIIDLKMSNFIPIYQLTLFKIVFDSFFYLCITCLNSSVE